MPLAGGWYNHCKQPARAPGPAGSGLSPASSDGQGTNSLGTRVEGLPQGTRQALNQSSPARLLWTQIRDTTSANKQPFCLASPEHLKFFDSDLEAYFPLL